MDTEYNPVEEANERLRNALTQLKKARQIHKAFLSLGKELGLGSGHEVFLSNIVAAISSLFPQVDYLVQLVDPKSLKTIVSDHAGSLTQGGEQKIHISHSALVKTRLDPGVASAACVEICEQIPFLFENSAYAIHVPLVSENQLYGAIQLETGIKAPLGDDDEVLLISLANHIALALRNQRLLDETAYLKDYLASILENANALIVVTNTNRQILVFNRAMENLLGFPKNQVLDSDLFKWVPAEEEKRLAQEISFTIEGKSTPGGIETRMRNRDGRLVQIIFHLAVLCGRDGEVESVIMVGQDLTQIRALEAQIIEAEKMATLGKLAAGIVHELNNPLTSISVYSEYLVKKMVDGTSGASDIEKMKRILEGAGRIQKLTRDLVSYGRPSSEEPEELNFNELIGQGLSFCEHTIRKYDVRVSTDLCPTGTKMVANRSQLLQIIINLITNACQAMEGGGELALSTKVEKQETMIFVVADTGGGIPERDLQHIFEPFYTTKKSGQGTGLGLSIVSRIIEHHRGTIDVSSSPGEGTTFEIRLKIEGTGEHEQTSAQS
jgi:two-component system, NtrC family, sensor kinase